MMLILATATSGFGQTLTQRLNDIVNRISTLQATVNNTFAQARDAALRTNGLPGVVARVQEVYNTVDGPGKQFIDSYVSMLLTLIDQHQEGFIEFTTPAPGGGVTPAAAFRTELTGFLNDLERLTNELIAIDGTVQFELDVNVVIRLVNALPDLLLYPFHVIMTRDTGFFNSGVRELIADLHSRMPAARELLGITGPVASAPVFDGNRMRSAASAQPAAVGDGKIIGEVFKIGGRTIAVVGKVLGAISEGEQKEGKVGIHGYIAIHAKVEPLKVIAGLVEVLGEMSENLGERILDKVNDNETAARHQALVDALTALQTDQDALLTGQSDVAAANAAILAQQQAILSGQDRILEAIERLDDETVTPPPPVPPMAAFSLASGPRRVHVDAGGAITLSAGADESPDATYQWRKDGSPIAGAVYSSFNIAQATADQTGIYDVIVTDEQGSRTSAPALVELIPSRLLNVSVRFDAPDDRITIAGFILDSPKRVVVRGVGRSLAAFGIPLERTMEDPTIALYNQAGDVIASNDNYEASPEIEAVMDAVGAFPLHSSTDAVIVTELPAGAYTVHVRSRHSTGGECIVEVYDTE